MGLLDTALQRYDGIVRWDRGGKEGSRALLYYPSSYRFDIGMTGGLLIHKVPDASSGLILVARNRCDDIHISFLDYI